LFAVGDLIEAENILWEVVKPKPADEPASGVTVAEHYFMLNGEVLAYAVKGYRAGGYHEVSPCDITRGWHSANETSPSVGATEKANANR
jgi:hypothetical protein